MILWHRRLCEDVREMVDDSKLKLSTNYCDKAVLQEYVRLLWFVSSLPVILFVSARSATDQCR